MKTSRSGSRSSCLSNHLNRRSATSGRPAPRRARSFFTRDGGTREEALDRAESKGETASGKIAANLLYRRVPVWAERRHHRFVVRFDAP
jgi:hypothetical protein